jgi:hypothetical protein
MDQWGLKSYPAGYRKATDRDCSTWALTMVRSSRVLKRDDFGSWPYIPACCRAAVPQSPDGRMGTMCAAVFLQTKSLRKQHVCIMGAPNTDDWRWLQNYSSNIFFGSVQNLRQVFQIVRRMV